MKINSRIVDDASAHVQRLLAEKLPAGFSYHNLSHTEAVAKAAAEIAEGCQVGGKTRNILLVAAWFHDLGYIDRVAGHEEAAVNYALEFLANKDVDEADRATVSECILATRYPQRPTTLLQQVICDADMVHLGKKEFFERAELIREEWACAKGEQFSDEEWYELNLQFLKAHQFHTSYCRDKYGKRKQKNLERVESLLEEAKANNQPQVTGLVEPAKARKKVKETNLPRGVETLFRSASGNHMRLSGMADNKAHILLSINSIIISIVLSVLAKKLAEAPYLLLPTILLLSVAVASIVFAVMTTRPKVSKGVFTKEQITNREANLLFFGNFHKMDLDTYQWGVREMMYDKEYLYSSMTKDIYFMGKVLAVKYRYLNIGYLVFMFGMIASILAFVLSLLLA
jgi:predicted metal-dependent HD superfamily phosphohydrolase